ncbi:MAG: glycoside-pentoside-hexuronide (GPH):cation symporter [Oscillospiraceae bacterium]|jgi:melibiose permease|nr:glycoside-pentoside-hexuronide (GPH):cation symporter [Oscillospiraceae bacterium]
MEGETTGQLSLATKLNYGVGAVGKSLSNGLSGRLQYYLLTVLRIDKRLLGPMLVAGRIWDGVNDLIMGAVIDNTRTKWGKFRPWIAIGALTNSLVMIGLFGAPGALRESAAGLISYITVLWLLWSLTYTMIDVSYWAMIPALSSTPRERDQVSMIPRVFGGVLGLATAFNIQIIKYLGGGDQVLGFRRFAILTSVVYVATSLYGAATVKEPHPVLPGSNIKKVGIWDAAKVLLRNKQALIILAVMLLFNLASNLTNGVAIYYFQFVIRNDTQFSLFNIMLGIAPGIGLVSFPLLTKYFDRRKVYQWSFFLPCIGYGAMALANIAMPGQFVPLAASVFVGFIGFGFMSIMQGVMLADCVDYGEYESGARNEGIIFCTLTMLSKLAGAANEAVTLTVFSIVHFGGQDALTATPAAVRGISWLMYVLPPIALALSYAIYRTLYKLGPERMAEVRGVLEGRRKDRVSAADVVS